MMDAALCGSFQCLRRTVQKNLAVLTVTFLQVLGAARGGNGRLSLGMLFRVLPTSGTAHAREKRLRRVPGKTPVGSRRGDPRVGPLVFCRGRPRPCALPFLPHPPE